MSRDTCTGWVLEQMILPSFARGGYAYKVRVKVGQHLRGTEKVEIVTLESFVAKANRADL